MSLLDPSSNYTITIGQKYHVHITSESSEFDHRFHSSLWNEEFYTYDYMAEWGQFKQKLVMEAIRNIPIEHLMSAQPYRYIKGIIRRYAKPKFRWAAKFEPNQSQVSVRMGLKMSLTIKVKDMGESRWRPYMKILLQPKERPYPF